MRFYSKKTWLKSFHSFSFSEHKESYWDNFGSIRVINEDIISPGCGFKTHSHSNIEIITLVIKGCLTHKDSLNNTEKIFSDEVQVMTAGKGISHSERNEENVDCKLFQIWIYPNKQNLKPTYKKNTLIKKYGIQEIINPKNIDLPTVNQQIFLWRCKYKKNDLTMFPKELNKFNWIQVIEGEIILLDKENDNLINLYSGDGLGFEVLNSSDIQIKSKFESDFLLFSMQSI